jgi:hypothetical protein
MKTLFSAAAALAVMAAAGVAMAQDEPVAPVKHHHHHHQAREEARQDGNTTVDFRNGLNEGQVQSLTSERTEHGGPPSSADERAATKKLNDQQLGGS